MTSTIAQALRLADPRLRKVSDTPNTDAQLLLGEVLGQSRTWILSHSEHSVTDADQAQFEAMLKEVVDGAALPHVLGWWEFYGRRFILDQEVLIPRPETELMIETALRLVAANARVLDIGTGSGCVAITLALELPAVRVYATDLSWSALQVARQNSHAHKAQKTVSLICGDLAKPFVGPFDLICANLPYISTEQLQHLAVAKREPQRALDGGQDGTELIFRAIETLPRILAPGGLALFEIDPSQIEGVLERAWSSLPSAELSLERDLAGNQRLLVIKRV